MRIDDEEKKKFRRENSMLRAKLRSKVESELMEKHIREAAAAKTTKFPEVWRDVETTSGVRKPDDWGLMRLIKQKPRLELTIKERIDKCPSTTRASR